MGKNTRALQLNELLGGQLRGRENPRAGLLTRFRLRGGRPLPSRLSREEKTLLKGLTAVADWIGSGSLFDDPAQAWPPLVPQAVEEAGYDVTEVK